MFYYVYRVYFDHYAHSSYIPFFVYIFTPFLFTFNSLNSIVMCFTSLSSVFAVLSRFSFIDTYFFTDTFKSLNSFDSSVSLFLWLCLNNSWWLIDHSSECCFPNNVINITSIIVLSWCYIGLVQYIVAEIFFSEVGVLGGRNIEKYKNKTTKVNVSYLNLLSIVYQIHSAGTDGTIEKYKNKTTKVNVSFFVFVVNC